MRIGLMVICSLGLLVLVSGSPVRCNACMKNECECKRKILKAAPVPPDPFVRKKVCEETVPTDLHPIKDICSCTDVVEVRPHHRYEDPPQFACSTSCECGLDTPIPPVKYSADAVSQQLAMIAARKKDISETDLHFHGNAARISEEKCQPDIQEELLHKFNRQLIELKPPKKKPVYIEESEEEFPCIPDQQSYSEICYGKVQVENTRFDQVHEEAPPCETCQDNSYEEQSYDEDDDDTDTDDDGGDDEDMGDGDDDGEEDDDDEGDDTDDDEDDYGDDDDDDTEDDCDDKDIYMKRSVRPARQTAANLKKKKQSPRNV